VRGVTTPRLVRALEILAPTCEAVDLHPKLTSLGAQCWAEIGYLRFELDDRAAAVAAMERAVGTDEQRASSCTEARPYLLLWRGDAAAAARAFRAALDALGPAKGDAAWFERLGPAVLELGLGRALRAAGDLRAARTALASSTATLVSLMKEHPTADIERRLGRAQIEFALTLANSGAPRTEFVPIAAAGIGWLQNVGGSPSTLHELEGLAAVR
jgi:hypothetical protein